MGAGRKSSPVIAGKTRTWEVTHWVFWWFSFPALVFGFVKAIRHVLVKRHYTKRLIPISNGLLPHSLAT